MLCESIGNARVCTRELTVLPDGLSQRLDTMRLISIVL